MLFKGFQYFEAGLFINWNGDAPIWHLKFNKLWEYISLENLMLVLQPCWDDRSLCNVGVVLLGKFLQLLVKLLHNGYNKSSVFMLWMPFILYKFMTVIVWHLKYDTNLSENLPSISKSDLRVLKCGRDLVSLWSTRKKSYILLHIRNQVSAEAICANHIHDKYIIS